MANTIFDKNTLDQYASDILSSTGVSFVQEERDKLMTQLREQLSVAVTTALINALDEASRKDFLKQLEVEKAPDKLIAHLGSKLSCPEEIAQGALNKFKEDFTQMYPSKARIAT